MWVAQAEALAGIEGVRVEFVHRLQLGGAHTRLERHALQRLPLQNHIRVHLENRENKR